MVTRSAHDAAAAPQARRRARRCQWEALCRGGIQDAVVRLLCRDGAGALTMSRVAAEAGVGKGTLYLYFRDKRHLLDSVRERSLAALRAELLGVLDGPGAARQKLEGLVRTHIGYCQEHRDLLRVLLWDRQFAGSRVRRRHNDGFQALVDRTADLLHEGMKEGFLRPADQRKAAAMLLESIIAVISLRLCDESPPAVEEDAALVLGVFLGGLQAQPAGRGGGA